MLYACHHQLDNFIGDEEEHPSIALLSTRCTAWVAGLTLDDSGGDDGAGVGLLGLPLGQPLEQALEDLCSWLPPASEGCGTLHTNH